MRIKTVVQLILIIFIIAIFYSFYFLYFKKNNSNVNNLSEEKILKEKTMEIDTTKKQDETQENLLKENNTNIINNIEYKSSDRKGNEYILKSKIGEIDINNKNVIKLNGVSGKIMLIEKDPIYIFSNYAVYNTENSDTKFFDEVLIKFEDNQIDSDNFDLFINENIAKIYNNVFFNNNLSSIRADIINIDLETGNINVDMYDKSNKVKFLKK
tara:strand:- start:398 stop:1033 length:636 start_codon:yes stop_codon:yes gene_type:complete